MIINQSQGTKRLLTIELNNDNIVMIESDGENINDNCNGEYQNSETPEREEELS